ncbi:DUF2064 domain-containing protein [Colwellia psychrerythraea]|uniref:Arsenite methyltransferase n=1 Tax=Colwellia psychrerythraea TaxID=28229 RepID=A0A099KUI2_COLPS|nr:DUF2064 domain-containing protein [Colwellia psychrerythraea]KGJ93855.1 Arsenite methyltransferase [Colwellia psychrerythraea]
MPTRATLVLMIKRPKLHQGKQRLAGEIGANSALVIAKSLLSCAVEDAANWPGKVVIAIAHQIDVVWATRSLKNILPAAQVIYQGEGNLGERINRVDEELRSTGHQSLVFIGTDSPMLNDNFYQHLPVKLAKSAVLLAKAEDGGVVMMASNAPWPDFSHLPWSSESLARALALCCQHECLSVTYHDSNYDIDQLVDLTRLKHDLLADERPARQRLLSQVFSCLHQLKLNHEEKVMHDVVKDYYGKVLQTSDDLQTNACCTDSQLPNETKRILANIHDEVLTKYYGCGLVSPELLANCHILDLGCGAGRDCYALAQLVGEQGSVIGVDMTEEQLSVARKYIDYHKEKFAYQKANTRFELGYIEKLDELALSDNSIDVIVSNCVINLSPDKEAVLAQAYRLLKPGGEIYFSDVYADRRIPEHLQADSLLYGECLSGALYQQDFQTLAQKVGFSEQRVVTSRAISINNPEIIARVAGINFTSVTYRLFKVAELEPHAEYYGQQVIYLGGINGHTDVFSLDGETHFLTDKITAVSGNTWRTLKASRFNQYFSFVGDFTQHLGGFVIDKCHDVAAKKAPDEVSCCSTDTATVATVSKSCC